MFKETAALLLLVLLSAPAATQAPAGPRVQTAVEALAQDGEDYARRYQVPLIEAMARLRAQEESAAATDRIRQLHAARVAGISVEHAPSYRVVVLLAGDAPVPDELLLIGGREVPVTFRTGAQATRDEIVAAMQQHRLAIRSVLPNASGMGLDQRTGEMVLLAKAAPPEDQAAALELDARLEALVGVPVRVDYVERRDRDFAVLGGARLEGIDPATGRRNVCTTGFVVRDSARIGIVTAAHCPDEISYSDPDDGPLPLTFVGQWGAQYQDVQVHATERAQRPLFYVDAVKREARSLTGWRTRTSARAGDFVCHRGERTGYSCSEIQLTDYAPPGELCGGPCDPVWVTVAGPNCRAGDSGGPVFSRTFAYGIVKGGNYREDGTCNFYYYMSVDFLPTGWTLAYEQPHAGQPGSGTNPDASRWRP